MSSHKKRVVTACIPCHNRKQKCNRRFPCNRCTHRRRPEECAYHAVPAARLPSTGLNCDVHQAEPPATETCEVDLRPSLVESFGWARESSSNTMALLKTWQSNGTPELALSDATTLPCIAESVEWNLARIPERQYLDALVRYFVTELDWMKQIVDAHQFLLQYEAWWNKDRPLATPDIEFAVLILRVCLYTAHFTSSTLRTIDRETILPLPEIRFACSEIGNSLAKMCVALDWKGSLVRVQHCLYAAIKYSCEGRTDKYWEGIGRATQAAQRAEIYRGSAQNDARWDMDAEMRRRVMYSLYIFDSHLVRQLDRVPFLPDTFIDHHTPGLPSNAEFDAQCNFTVDEPALFAERLLQFRLARFWRLVSPARDSYYDPIQAEERHERFREEFLGRLPPAFALTPEKKWDDELPRLRAQRQLLHIYIYDSICWNFRPSLLLRPDQIAELPEYKRVLLRSQKQAIARAAVRELEAVSSLHALFPDGCSHFGTIVFNTFEAAVIILTLCTHEDLQLEDDHSSILKKSVPSGSVTRAQMIRAAETALDRLQTLAAVNDMAAAGAKTLAQLYSSVINGSRSRSMIGDGNSLNSDAWAHELWSLETI